MNSDLNTDTFCRLCLRVSSDMVPLFESLIGETLVSEVILTTVGLELDDSSDFPRQACQDCIKEVNSMYIIQQVLIKCQSLLVQWKSNGEPIVESAGGIIIASGQSVSDNQSSMMQLKSDDLQKKIVENSINPKKISSPFREQIKLEPIDIKDEQCSIDDDDTTDSLNNENHESELFQQKTKIRTKNSVAQKYTCEFCQKDFSLRRNLWRHQLIHRNLSKTSNAPKTEVTSCELSPREDDCIISEHNESDERENFPNCSKGKTLRQADPNEVKTIPHKCYICDTTLEDESDFNDHLETHKFMLPYKCLQCSTEENHIETSSVRFLNKHFETHGFYYICPLCPLRYRKKVSLSYHRRYGHKEHKLESVCETCGKVCRDRNQYRNHTRSHERKWKHIKCLTCQKVFRSYYFFEKHSKSYQCLRNKEKKSHLKMITKEMSNAQAETNMTLE